MAPLFLEWRTLGLKRGNVVVDGLGQARSLDEVVCGRSLIFPPATWRSQSKAGDDAGSPPSDSAIGNGIAKGQEGKRIKT